MTDTSLSNRSAELPALIEERRKYESWLAALDARRESTAPHVFDRVKADYQARLQQVESRLAAHRQSIEEERTSLESRRSLLAAEEQLRRDERAELELRAHVGELAGGDADSAFRAVDESLEKLTEERDGLTTRIAELDALLVGRPAEASEPTPEPDAVAEAEQAPEQAPEPAPESKPVAEAAPAEPIEPAEPHMPATPRTPGGSFDELAFVSDVIGTRERKSEVVRDGPASQSLLDDLRTRDASTEAPLAANVPANTPIVLRTSGAMEQSKTLKCNECGAMNYPTEWYCERCGAELAAL